MANTKRKLIDLTGQQFGRLTVLTETRVPDRIRPSGRKAWICRCVCGTFVTLKHGQLVSKTRSCGCLSSDVTVAQNRARKGTHRKAIRFKELPEYETWCGMKKRCNNPNTKGFSDYGGRGITVCDRWQHSFADFLADMGSRPSRDHTIERINNEKGYSPDNCKWLEKEKQAQNKRNNRTLTFKGETLCISEWARRTGFHIETLRRRLAKNWSIEHTLTVRLRRPKSAS